MRKLILAMFTATALMVGVLAPVSGAERVPAFDLECKAFGGFIDPHPHIVFLGDDITDQTNRALCATLDEGSGHRHFPIGMPEMARRD